MNIAQHATLSAAFKRPSPLDSSSVKRIALVGNFLPRLCGIATFTSDIYNAFVDRFPDVAVDVYAMNDGVQDYDYPPAVVGTIEEKDAYSYLDAARQIEESGADLVWIQHEYGIFGGEAGEHILKLTERVTLPVALTLHTVLEKPNAAQRRVMDALVARASKLIVMADQGKLQLMDVYGAREDQVVVIPHGVHDRPLADTAGHKARFGLAGREVVLTFGLLSPGKGIETMIAAMPAIVARRPNAHYVVLGATHPNLLAKEGEAYRDRLMTQARDLGVADHISWINDFVETDKLLDWLTAADVYVTPYLNPAQMTSGTLSYAVGLGKPVVSTPYVHAAELLADGHGRLVGFGDSAGFAREIVDLLEQPAVLETVRLRNYALGRTMIWPRLAEAAMTAFDDAIATLPTPLKANRPMPVIPDTVAFDAVERLSDSTGILQHSIFAVPDRRHGYCVDDNARALILMHQLDVPAACYDRWTPIYASFVQYAWNQDRNCFRNFMSFDRRWLEEEGSEDSSARAVWSLGVTARDARHVADRRWAAAFYDQCLRFAETVSSPRAHAFVMLAAVARLDADPAHAASRAILERSGDALMALVDAVCRPDWAWFEIVLAYDNCRLPEALLRAGLQLRRQDFIERGIETLEWIVDQQTAKAGHFRPVGSESFGRELTPPLPFDQQPLEAWATIEACAAALDATGDAVWRDEAMRAYRWFQGENDLHMPLGDPADGECYDGLMPHGVNQNRGAESVLAFHLATAAIKTVAGRGTDHRGVIARR